MNLIQVLSKGIRTYREVEFSQCLTKLCSKPFSVCPTVFIKHHYCEKFLESIRHRLEITCTCSTYFLKNTH